jgi:hypothetical protein
MLNLKSTCYHKHLKLLTGIDGCCTRVDVVEHAELSDPMIEYASEFAAILKTSLSTTQAAKRLGGHAVRIRQMIGDGTLYAVQVDGRCRTEPSNSLEALAVVSSREYLRSL